MKYKEIKFITDLICNISVGHTESLCKTSFTKKVKNRRNYYLLKEVIKNVAKRTYNQSAPYFAPS